MLVLSCRPASIYVGQSETCVPQIPCIDISYFLFTASQAIRHYNQRTSTLGRANVGSTGFTAPEALQKLSFCRFQFPLKGVPAKYVSTRNTILLATLFPAGKRQKAFRGREWGSLLNASRKERVWLRVLLSGIGKLLADRALSVLSIHPRINSLW